jgi:hypothetical protein
LNLELTRQISFDEEDSMTTRLITDAAICPQARRAVKALAWLAALMLFSAAHVLAQGGEEGPIVVDAATPPCVPEYSRHYTTIQTPVDAAASGGTVLVCPGTYPEQVTIRLPLTLRGVTSGNNGAAVISAANVPGGLSSNFNNAFPGFSVYAQVLIQAPNVQLVNLTVDGAGAFSGSCQNLRLVGAGFDTGSSGTLKRIALRNQSVPAPLPVGFCQAGFGLFGIGTSVTVQDSVVRGFDLAGVAASQSLVVDRSVFSAINSGPGPICIALLSGTGTISNNTLDDCGVVLEQSFGTTVTKNTITRGQILCGTACSTATITENTVAGTGISIFGGPGAIGNSSVTSGVGFEFSSIQDNDISGVGVGVFLCGTISPFGNGSTSIVSGNTINDASVGVLTCVQEPNTVINNTFLNVTTLSEQVP